MYDKWCKVLDTVPEREQKLADEMAKQQANEELRVAFAEKANALAEYISQRQSELADQSMKALGTMEVPPPHLSYCLLLSTSPLCVATSRKAKCHNAVCLSPLRTSCRL